MPARPLPVSSAVGSFLKEQRQKLGYTLREVESLSGESGKVIPFSTLARIEQGRLDPGLPRLQQLLRVYHVPMQAAGDLLDLEQYAGLPPKLRDPQKLFDLGKERWQRGEVREALTAFMAAKRLDPTERLLRHRIHLGLSTVS